MENAPLLDRYVELIGETFLENIYKKARSVEGIRVLHINTTYRGGGVAELLGALTPITDNLNIQHKRKVIQLDPDSNHFTTRIVDMLQGGIAGTIPEKEKQNFLRWLQQTLPQQPTEEEKADIYFIHDFQLIPLARLFPWLQPAIWFCHIDTDKPNPDAVDYIMEYQRDYQLCVFNNPFTVFKQHLGDRAQVLTLGIDPFTEKNAALSADVGEECLIRCGIDPKRPLVTQVARFDRWKNPWQAIDIYRRVKREEPEVQLALVGAMEAADDINALNILHDVQKYAQGDPDIHLLSDPKVVRHREVNALQRYSSVILQRSTKEGFGLTITEAMWKYQPVIGTTATGPRTQIIHGTNGYISDETEEATAYTLHLLRNRDKWEEMGQQAHEHVRQHYLIPTMLIHYLSLLESVSGRTPSQTDNPGAIPAD